MEDDDGDLDVPRRSENDEHPEELYLEIEHQLSSSLHEVGMQIWRGSLVMADYLIQVYTLKGSFRRPQLSANFFCPKTAAFSAANCGRLNARPF